MISTMGDDGNSLGKQQRRAYLRLFRDMTRSITAIDVLPLVSVAMCWVYVNAVKRLSRRSRYVHGHRYASADYQEANPCLHGTSSSSMPWPATSCKTKKDRAVTKEEYDSGRRRDHSKQYSNGKEHNENISNAEDSRSPI